MLKLTIDETEMTFPHKELDILHIDIVILFFKNKTLYFTETDIPYPRKRVTKKNELWPTIGNTCELL